ncbi:MAG TPA: PilC/PilY family type IV pilus protein, partial [Acidobacteriota bacterium]
MVVVGANDGMVHAFSLTGGFCLFTDDILPSPGDDDDDDIIIDPPPIDEEVTGDDDDDHFPTGGREAWSFIPRNVVPKLKSTRLVSEDGTSVAYNRLPMVDSTAAVSDAYFDVDGDGLKEWRTVVVFGQGPGTGTGDLNYYFALDVTDTCNPQPLWEWSDAIDDYDGEPGVANDPEAGQSWSVPFIAQAVDDDGEDKWYAFFASGYDENEGDSDFKGNQVYALDIATGHMRYKVTLADLDDAANIPNALPGSPNGVDLDGDGRIDRLYFGDLEGRLVRLDVHNQASADVDQDAVSGATTVNGDSGGWNPCVKVNLTSNDDPEALPMPIFVRPAISLESALDQSGNPIQLARVYFGTGGDDRAPADQTYAFYGLKDQDPIGGNCSLIDINSANSYVFETSDTQPILLSDDGTPTGERVWADPLIMTRSCTRGGGSSEAVVFSTLVGNIENTNPCMNEEIGSSPYPGRLFARFIKNECRSGTSITSGETGFLDNQGARTVQYLQTASKARGLGGLGQQHGYKSGLNGKQTLGQSFYFSQYAGSGTGGASEGGTHNSAAWFEWGFELGFAPKLRSFEEVY